MDGSRGGGGQFTVVLSDRVKDLMGTVAFEYAGVLGKVSCEGKRGKRGGGVRKVAGVITSMSYMYTMNW